MSQPKTVAELAEEQAKEYGTYVATEPIYIEGALAFNPGDGVPVGHVDSGKVKSESVAKRGSKAASTVTAEPEPKAK